MKTLVIEPHYLGSLEYYSLLLQYSTVRLEVCGRFKKQTFRNRCYLLTTNGVQPMIIPLRYAASSLYKEVTIDYSQRWIKDHWGAFYSAYGKAPFFEHFVDPIREIWEKKMSFLIDLNLEFLQMTLKILQKDVNMTYTENYEESYPEDFRGVILPKKSYVDRKIYRTTPYTQLFTDTFIPNLSILDLIMNEGPYGSQVLAASFLRERDNLG